MSAIESIKSRLKDFNFEADIKPMQGIENSYLLCFADNEMAQDVFHKAGEIGFKVVKKWPARPNPNRPI